MSTVALSNRSVEVDAFMAALDHPLREEIDRMRIAILASNEGIAESIKWNAPNFRYLCDDRVTFRFPPKGGLQLIFHRGVAVKDAAGFAFPDDTGLLRWAAPDRGVLTLGDGPEITANTAVIVDLVNRWMAATSN
jgi:hypothetical protein